MNEYLLGIDNGLSSVKAVIFNLSGDVISEYSSSTNVQNLKNGKVEIDMNSLWNTTADTIFNAVRLSDINPDDIKAIGSTAHGNGVYIVDNSGIPLRPAIMPMDSRSIEFLEKIRSNGIEKALFDYILQNAWTGQPSLILNWIKHNENDIYKKIYKILLCKDWIKYKLSGRYSTDYSDISASGLFDNVKKKYNSEIMDMYGISEVYEFLPEVYRSFDIVGRINEKASQQTGLTLNTPLVSGALDVSACITGAGVNDYNHYGIVAGTWSINASFVKEDNLSDEITQNTIFCDGIKYLAIDSSATSTVNLEWFLKKIAQFGDKRDYEKINSIVSRYDPDDLEMIFIPFIYSSLKFPKVKAGFYNLKEENDWEDMLRSVYEGIVFGHKLHIDTLKKIGIDNKKARLTGGAGKSEVWCRMFADVLNIEIETVETSQTGALGAAILAGIGVDIFKDIDEGIDKMVKVKNTYKPIERNYKIYKRKYDEFLSIVNGVK